jgi:hypothetical protein
MAKEVQALKKAPMLNCSVLGPLIFGQQRHNTDGDVKNHFELLTLLELRRNSKATDPRDKIFFLLRLSTESQKRMVPTNYSYSIT